LDCPSGHFDRRPCARRTWTERATTARRWRRQTRACAPWRCRWRSCSQPWASPPRGCSRVGAQPPVSSNAHNRSCNAPSRRRSRGPRAATPRCEHARIFPAPAPAPTPPALPAPAYASAASGRIRLQRLLGGATAHSGHHLAQGVPMLWVHAHTVGACAWGGGRCRGRLRCAPTPPPLADNARPLRVCDRPSRVGCGRTSACGWRAGTSPPLRPSTRRRW